MKSQLAGQAITPRSRHIRQPPDFDLFANFPENLFQRFFRFLRPLHCHKYVLDVAVDIVGRLEILVDVSHHAITPRGESIGIVLGFLIGKMYQLVSGYRNEEGQITNIPALKPDYHDHILGPA